MTETRTDIFKDLILRLVAEFARKYLYCRQRVRLYSLEFCIGIIEAVSAYI
jgi:hypothetical protein